MTKKELEKIEAQTDAFLDPSRQGIKPPDARDVWELIAHIWKADAALKAVRWRHADGGRCCPALSTNRCDCGVDEANAIIDAALLEGPE